MQKNAQIGENGELLAKEFLLQKKYIILQTNWRYKRSEIDIIAQDKNIVVFVEVKTRNNASHGNAENFVNTNKIKKMHEAAAAYIEAFNWNGELRFDIIAVEKEKITHFEDAFY